MQKNALIGIVAAIGAIVVIAPLGYAFAQRAAITSLEFDFDRFELTEIDFSETQSFGSMQRIVAGAENPTLSMLEDIQSLQSSIATPESFALDLIANTRLTYSIFVDVHNPSSFEAVIDRAQIVVSINGKNLTNPLLINQQYRIGPGQTVEVELSGISINGKEVAGILYNLATDDFILTMDFAITSYFPTLLGEVSVPANVNIQMYLIPPKPEYVAFEDPNASGVQQVAYEPSSNVYKLSFANENDVPISGKLEVGVMKGNALSNIGFCDPACIAPIDNGFATALRIKGSSIFGVQVFESEDLNLDSGEMYDFDVENPVLRSNANSAFIIRWAPDYEKIPYIINANLLGINKVSEGEFESPSFSIVRMVAYNIINDFGYVGSEEFVSPDKSISLTLYSSDNDVEEGDRVTFSGQLTDVYGRGIPDRQIIIMENDPVDADDYLTDTYTDSSGEFEVSWTVEDTEFWNNELDVFATFEGDAYYEEGRSDEISVEISSSGSQGSSYTEPSQESTDLAFDISEYSVYEGDSVEFSGMLIDSSGDGIAGATIYFKDEDSFDFDDDIGYVQTASDGTFTGTWEVERMDDDDTIEIYAVFEGSAYYSSARSPEIELEVIEYQQQAPEQPEYHSADITIDVSSQDVDEDDTVIISGQLTDEDGDGIANALIYIKDEDAGSGDDILGTVFTDSDGDYVFEWQATPNDPFDNVVEIYTIFEGSQYYSQARSAQVSVQVN